MDNWDPRRDDFKDANFNSYTRGPGRNMPVNRGNKGNKRVQLFVTGIPNEVTEDGLKNLFSRVGEVLSVSKKKSKRPDAPDTFGFVEMENATAAEKAMREYNNFKIGGFTLRVKVSLNEQEKRRNNNFLQEDSVFSLDDNAGSDTDPLPSPWDTTVQNGFGNEVEPKTRVGVGRGQKLADLNAATKDALLPTPKLSPMQPPTNNLSVSVHEPYQARDISAMYGVGRGQYKPQKQAEPKRGRGKQRGYNRGSRGHRYNNYNGHRGRGRGYYDYYDNHHHGYMQGYGQEQQYPQYPPPPPVMYGMQMIDPYAYGMMAAGAASQHLLQPAYNPMMATPMMNMTGTQQQQQQQLANQSLPTPSATRKAKPAVRYECSVCSKLGTLCCSRCKQPYCSATCQKDDWPEHKEVCKIMQKENEANQDFVDQFDVSVGDELIPKVKELMEKVTGGKINITKKPGKEGRQSGYSSDAGMKNGHREPEPQQQQNVQRQERSHVNSNSSTSRDQTVKEQTVRSSGPVANTQHEQAAKRDRGCFNCGSQEHRRKDCTQPEGFNIMCYNCQQMGHMSRECPKRTEKNCYTCGGMGHLSKDCPNKSGGKPSDKKYEYLPRTKPPTPSLPPPGLAQDDSILTNGRPATSNVQNDSTSVNSQTPPRTLAVENLPLHVEIKVVVTDVQNPSCIWLQKASQETMNKLQTVMPAMAEKYSSSKCNVGKAVVGEYYGCQFSEDNLWYRSRVLNVNGSLVDVQYVDFGNTEQTRVDKLRQLNEGLMMVPSQAIKVSLEGVEPCTGSDWSLPPAQWLSHIIPNQECKLKAHKKQGPVYEVTLKNLSGENVAQNLIADGLAKQSSSSQPGSYSNVTDSDVNECVGPLMAHNVPHIGNSLSVGQTVTVLMTEMSSPALFHVQILTDASMQAFTDFVAKLNQVYNKNTELRYSPTILGELVVSRFSGDNDWYRGQAAEINSKSSTIVFLDYGNSEVVSINRLRKAEKMCTEVPLQAVKCSLAGMQNPADGQWPQSVLQYCSTLENKPLSAKIIEIRGECVYVELYQISTGASILDELQQLTGATGGPKHKPTPGPTGDARPAVPKPAVAEPSVPKPAAPEKLVPKPDASKQSVPTPEAPKPSVPKSDASKPPLPKPAAPERVPVVPEPSVPLTSVQPGTQSAVCIAPVQLALTGEPVEVAITNIISTGQFYLQLGDTESRESLGKMWLELNEFYTSVEPYVAAVGEFVAAQFTEGGTTLWYRARVLEKPDSDTYTVFFIDYGNTDTVHRSAVAKLDPKFASLPSQALCCKLARCADTQDGVVLAEFSKYQEVLSLAKVTDFRDNVYTVDLYQPEDGTNINEGIMSVLKAKLDSGVVSEMPPLVSEGTLVTQAAGPATTLMSPELPVDGTLMAGFVVYIEDLSKFYIHIMDDSLEKYLAALLSLSQVCEKDSSVYKPRQYEYVSAKFTADNSWYRARVMRELESGLEVFFIDFGNMDIVCVDNVRKPCEELDHVPMLAVQCALAGSQNIDTTDKLEDFKSLNNQAVKIKVLHKTQDAYIVELFLTDEAATSVNTVLNLDVSTAMSQVDQEESRQAMSQQAELPESPAAVSAPSQSVQATAVTLPTIQTKPLTVGSSISAAPLLIHSVNHFYLQCADEAAQGMVVDIFLALTKQYNYTVEGYVPTVGEFVAVHYNDGNEELWYRACVTDKLADGQFALHLIDYGNDLQINTDKVRQLDGKFYQYPQLIYKCRLHGFDVDTEATRQELSKLSLNMETKVTVRALDGDVYSVDMETLEGQDLATHLTSTLGKASALPCTDIVDQLPPQTPKQDPLPQKKSASPASGGERKVVFAQTLPQSKPESDSLSVVITSVVRPNLFHCQVFQEDQTNLRELKLLSDSMKLDCEASQEDQHKWEVGELCCAKFPEDGEWYRGSVLEVFPDHTVTVSYVDFGNTSEVSTSQLRPVTLEYTVLPRLAFKCSLHGVSPVGASWSQEAVAKLCGYQDRPVRARVVEVNNDVYELDLETVDGENVGQQLIQAGLATKPSAQAPSAGGEVQLLQEQNKLLQQQLSEMQAMMAQVLKKAK